jgi:hypothetical protein
LYWKWMWSMMRRPGESKIESAAACDCFFDPSGDDLTYLENISIVCGY